MKEKFRSIKICPLWASVRLSRVSVRTGFPVSNNKHNEKKSAVGKGYLVKQFLTMLSYFDVHMQLRT